MELKHHPWKQCEFELYKDNEPTGKIYVLNDENNWCIEEWLDDEHEYDFREINIPRGYKPEYYRYRDDQVNNIMVRNIGEEMWTINLKCDFDDNIDLEDLQPTQLSFKFIYNDENQEVVLNEENNWTVTFNDKIPESDINDYKIEIKSNIYNTPQLLFYSHSFSNEVNESAIDITYEFKIKDGIKKILQNLIESMLTEYAKTKDIEGILSNVGISRTSNNNMRIRKIEREIKRLQKELDIIKSEK